jgi:hypothetical protein
VGASASHSPMGLYGLLQGQLCLLLHRTQLVHLKPFASSELMGSAVRLPITDKQLLSFCGPAFERSHYFPHFGSDSHHKGHVERTQERESPGFTAFLSSAATQRLRSRNELSQLTRLNYFKEALSLPSNSTWPQTPPPPSVASPTTIRT